MHNTPSFMRCHPKQKQKDALLRPFICRYKEISACRTNRKEPSGGGGEQKSLPLSGVLDERKNVKKEPRGFEELPPDIQKILDDRKTQKNNNKTIMDSLESKYIMSLILYLDRMSPTVKSDIYNDVSRSATMPGKIDTLERLRLIQVYRTAHTNTNVVVITDKGRKVAEKIRELVDEIEEGL